MAFEVGCDKGKVFGGLAGLFLNDPDVAELQRITVAL